MDVSSLVDAIKKNETAMRLLGLINPDMHPELPYIPKQDYSLSRGERSPDDPNRIVFVHPLQQLPEESFPRDSYSPSMVRALLNVSRDKDRAERRINKDYQMNYWNRTGEK